MKSFVIPAHFVPDQTVTRCDDCPHFGRNQGSWGEYSICLHPKSNDEDLRWEAGSEIAVDCPELVNEFQTYTTSTSRHPASHR